VSIWTGIALAAVATGCYQVGIVLQKKGADRLPRLELRVRQGAVYGAFFRSRIWLGGLVFMLAGWALFLKAIANAPVSIVQPVLGLGLALLALFSVVFLRERLRSLEWVGVALMVGGIVLLGVSGSGDTTHAASLGLVPLAVVSLAVVGALAGAVAFGRSGGTVPAPVVLGFAAGVLIGLAALYTKGLFLSLEAGMPWLAWLVFLPLTLAGNIGGLWVQQAGFQQGRALIVVAMNAVTNKIVAIVGGMVTLGELLPDDARLATARIVGFVVILAGTALLARFSGEELSSRDFVPARETQRA
jgi:drug/metabolite transporter (DMT)-like permease